MGYDPGVGTGTHWVGLAVALGALAGAPRAHAHPLAPVLLEVREVEGGALDVTWRVPRLAARGVDVTPLLPADCREEVPAVTTRGDQDLTRRWRMTCAPGDLVGRTVGVRGLVEPMSALIRIVLADGREIERVVQPAEPAVVVPASPRILDVVASYLRLGFHHIGTGPDHLLLVFGLVLLAPAPRVVAGTVSAFTVGHSLTLALAATGLVALPSGPIEILIALSVLVLAIEVARVDAGAGSWLRRRPWMGAGSFGLLHGLAFAAALSEAGLPSRAVPPALLAFNAGIEIGQLAFVLVVLLGVAALRRVVEAMPRGARLVPVYAMGTLAAFWCFERAAAWLGP